MEPICSVLSCLPINTQLFNIQKIQFNKFLIKIIQQICSSNLKNAINKNTTKIRRQITYLFVLEIVFSFPIFASFSHSLPLSLPCLDYLQHNSSLTCSEGLDAEHKFKLYIRNYIIINFEKKTKAYIIIDM